MRHHHHVPRCRHHAAARCCRIHRPPRAATGRRPPDPRASCSYASRGSSRIAPTPNREPRGREAAGQTVNRAIRIGPDCWGRLAVKLRRLFGGRR
jgi:hypothetical protein